MFGALKILIMNTMQIRKKWICPKVKIRQIRRKSVRNHFSGPDCWFDPPVEKFTEDQATKRQLFLPDSHRDETLKFSIFRIGDGVTLFLFPNNFLVQKV